MLLQKAAALILCPLKLTLGLSSTVSQEGDAVVDAFSSNGYTMAAALREGHNALCDASNSEQASLQIRISTFIVC